MRRAGRLRVGQRFAVVTAILGVLLVAGIIAGAIAMHQLSDARSDLLDRVGPARTGALSLQTAFLNEETGVRGFVVTGEPRFLEPYRRGRSDEVAQTAALRRLMRHESVRSAAPAFERVLAAGRRWRTGFVLPALAAQRAGAPPRRVDRELGRERFDELRRAFTGLQRQLDVKRDDGRDRLDDTADHLGRLMAMFAFLLVLGGVGASIFVRRAITLPLAALADEVRRVADGDFDRGVEADGPADIVALAEDVDSMRARIVQELTAVRAIQEDLERSNTELEQFAYVASHDLQEPLRKVASFTQMLQRRYEGQLDEKADQYIFFAVDGAKRMQELINDLLAFSRVGRVVRDHQAVPLGTVVDRALTDLTGAIEASAAQVTVTGETPMVRVDPGLMALVFQNLIGNAIKFREEDVVPQITVTTTVRGSELEVAIHDEGIGIDDEYADRIFVIFQRLHPKERYGGTGIGLAMCRKIVEYHGGRIWLDTGSEAPAAGTTFRFTLPIDQEPETP
ncbi:hypothetical protein DSM112329_04053 [Paraconexibacter sp. AEG42_29]|uniref:histidine kinase n=1 Tax=Paraconexibacter sp. AEG42_29 TaxID=2997339 RepID=A0AAU7AZV9_9ACTN